MKSIFDNFNDLTQRVITAALGAIVIIIAILWNEWAYFAVFLGICIFTQLEFYKLLKLDEMLPLKFWGTMAGVIIYIIVFMEQKYEMSSKYYFLLLPVIYMAFVIKLYKKTEKKPFTNIGLTFLGIIYVALPFALLHVSAYHTGPYTYQIIVGIIFIQWASDTGAYFAGIRFGKRKLFERVSPKKSWEGFLGGMMLALLMSVGMSIYFGTLEFWKWISIALIVAVVGTYGDLLESLFKRSMEIKDSGSSIPGHGGFLDRFDSLLLSLPFIAAFLKIF